MATRTRAPHGALLFAGATCRVDFRGDTRCPLFGTRGAPRRFRALVAGHPWARFWCPKVSGAQIFGPKPRAFSFRAGPINRPIILLFWAFLGCFSEIILKRSSFPLCSTPLEGVSRYLETVTSTSTMIRRSSAFILRWPFPSHFSPQGPLNHPDGVLSQFVWKRVHKRYTFGFR